MRDSLPCLEARGTSRWTAASKIVSMLQRSATSKSVKLIMHKLDTSLKQSTCKLLKSCLCRCAQFCTTQLKKLLRAKMSNKRMNRSLTSRKTNN